MNAALIGYGYWGKIVALYLKDSEFFTLKTIYSKDQEDNMEFSPNIDDIIYNKTIEAVFLCTPTPTHFSICKQMLESGKHVFCEKPTVKNLEEMSELSLIALQHNQVLYTDYIYTVSPSINIIKENLYKIGAVKAIRSEISQFGQFYQDDDVYETIGIHIISAIFHILGNAYKKSTSENILGSYTCRAGNIRILFDIGFSVEIFCSLLNYTKERTLKIYGEKGTFVLDLNLAPSLTMICYESIDDIYTKTQETTWDLDEKNNLKYSIDLFSEFIKKKDYESNITLSTTVLKVLREISNDLR